MTRTGNFISFGAGIQSTTLVLMSLSGELERADAVIFADTQSEPSWVYKTVQYVRHRCCLEGMPFYIVTAGNLMTNTLAMRGTTKTSRHVGQPPLFVRDGINGGREGRLWRKCTTYYKIKPIMRAIREHLGAKRITKYDRVTQWVGISLDEIARANLSPAPWLRRYPLLDKRMTRHDCVMWLVKHGHPVPRKSACVMCPYRSSANWLELKRESPADFDRAVAWDEKLRADGALLPGVRNPAYVHRSLVPLGEIDFDDNPDQLDLFLDECEGVCGV